MTLRGTLFRGNCSCIPAARSRGNFASERIACMRDVIPPWENNLSDAAFYPRKNKKQTPSRWFATKKRRIEGDLRSIKVNPGNDASSPFSLASVTSDLLRAVRSNFYKRVECPRGIYYSSWRLPPAVARITSTQRLIDTLNSSILN